MLRVCNLITGTCNAVGSIVGSAVLAVGIWIAVEDKNYCTDVIRWPVIGIGFLVVVLSVAGLVGVCMRNNCVLGAYMVGMVLVILFLMSSITLLLAQAQRYPSDSIPNKLDLRSYSPTLRSFMSNPSTWIRVRSCVEHADVCSHSASPTTQFFRHKLSIMQNGCCKPPVQCGFRMVNSTYWREGKHKSADTDCKKWKNDKHGLCYGCESCMAGVLASISLQLRRLAILYLAILSVVLCVFVCSFCAWQNNRRPKNTVTTL